MTCMWQRVTQDHATKYHVSTAGGIYRCTLYPGIIGFRGNSADDANNCGTVLVLVLYRTRYIIPGTYIRCRPLDFYLAGVTHRGGLDGVPTPLTRIDVRLDLHEMTGGGVILPA